VQFNGVSAVFSSFGGSLFATVPAGAGTGLIQVTTPSGSATSSTAFAVVTALSPQVSSFTPNAGGPGTVVSIEGTNLANATQVSFSGLTANFVALSDAKISAEVPSNAITGPITVASPAGTITTSTDFYVPAQVLSFDPKIGVVGTLVTIHGINFTGALGVSFGSVSATYTNISDTEIQAVVPTNGISGSISVATLAGVAFSADTFVLPPKITGFDPPSGAAGTEIIVSGANLSAATRVQVDGADADFIPISDAALSVVVPSSAQDGLITVTTPAGSASSTKNFRVGIFSNMAVSVTAVPDSVKVGDFLSYSVMATNLGPFTATNVVLTEVLPSAVTLVFPPSGAPCVVSGNVVTCTLGDLVPGQGVTIKLSTSINDGPYLTNQVTATQANAELDPSDNSFSLLTVLAGAPPPPDDKVQLSTAMSGNALQILWPGSVSGFILESTRSLIPPITWSSSDTPVILNGQNTVFQNPASGQRFYRLRKQ
jgi:uncharacterized repeat protein (TIGR01451 family)